MVERIITSVHAYSVGWWNFKTSVTKIKAGNLLVFLKEPRIQVSLLTAFSQLNDIKFVIVFTFSTSPLSAYCSVIACSCLASSEFERVSVSGSCRVGLLGIESPNYPLPWLNTNFNLGNYQSIPLTDFDRGNYQTIVCLHYDVFHNCFWFVIKEM